GGGGRRRARLHLLARGAVARRPRVRARDGAGREAGALLRPALGGRADALGDLRGHLRRSRGRARALPGGGAPRARERRHVVRARGLLRRARAVGARLRRAQQLVHLRPLRLRGEAVRTARPGARKDLPLRAEERAQAVPSTTTSCEPLSIDGRSLSAAATT